MEEGGSSLEEGISVSSMEMYLLMWSSQVGIKSLIFFEKINLGWNLKSPFLVHLPNIFIGENGTIDGQGDVWWNMWRKKTLKFTRPNLVEFVNSQDIIISNVIFKNSPFWNIHPVYCKYDWAIRSNFFIVFSFCSSQVAWNKLERCNLKPCSFFAAMLWFGMSQFWLLVTLLILMESIQVKSL